MVQHVGHRIKDRGQGIGVTLAVGNQHLYGRSRVGLPDSGDRGRKGRRPTIGEVIARNGRHHGVRKPHVGHRSRHPPRLGHVEIAGPTGVDQAEPTRPGTALAVDHERGRAVVPAVEDVGTAGLLAHGDQLLPTHQAPEASVLRAGVERHPHPLWLTPDRWTLPRPLPPAERTQVTDAGAPRHIGALDGTPRPLRRSPFGNQVHNLGHRGLDPLGSQGGDTEAGDSTRDHAVKEREVRVHVQGETVHRARTRQLDADCRHLARVCPLGVHPHARVGLEPAHVGKAQIATHPDEQVLDRAHIGHRVGHAPTTLSRKVQERVAHNLARTVERDVTPTVSHLKVGPYLLRRRQEVLGGGPHPQGVDGVVLQEQQVVVDAVLMDAPLQGQRIAVTHPPQPADAKRPGGQRCNAAQNSDSQSWVSMTSRNLARKAAA